jgi:kumamolisin
MLMDSNIGRYRAFLLASALTIPFFATVEAQTKLGVTTENSRVAADVLKIPDIQDAGRRSAGEQVDILVTLRFNRTEELDQLLKAQNDPSSPDYQQYLTTEQFTERFGPTEEQVAKVISELKTAGFEVTSTSSNRLLIHASAPSVNVESYFQTEIHSVTQLAQGTRYMNVKPATLPDRLVSLVRGVRLDNLIVAHKLSNISPSVITGPVNGPAGGFAPFAIAEAYDFPVQHGFSGKGHTAAVIIDSDVVDSDLNAFFSYYGISRTGSISRVSIDGATIGSTNSDGDETALDVETIASLAPGANVEIYLIPQLSDQAIDDAINQIVSDNTAEAVNMSFGGSEFQDTTFEAAVQQGNAQGITFVASSGDNGSQGGVSTPAAEPLVLAVGGTQPMINSSTGRYSSETAWSGSGGGVSTVFSIPSYQKGVSGLASTSHRNVPDVAFPSYYTDTYVNGAWVGLQGTSWSSPTYVALQLEINQRLKKRFGLVNSHLYQLFKSGGYTYFHDVTSGNNGGFSAKTGYDNVTGIGSPKGNAIAGHLQ